ncbi:uncharacterized protein PV09_09235 [Verruconis gallopava]|uniref:Transcription factor domain-containing protein n=1 Tax=Verruconis gallopava TaxID=253628 RepID=A0A0D1ZYB4_9PEZI|nr:uncharacterized protein PV09_09235 [Verruconis gallopava]KIV99069.1 hypothetical protein PV09_09235 [Verruconis gallopava]
MNLLRKDVAHMFSTLSRVCEYLNLEPPLPLLSEKDAKEGNREAASPLENSSEDGEYELSPPTSPSAAQAPIDTYLTSAQQEAAAESAGAARPRTRRKTAERPDLISKGLVSAEEAEGLVQSYLSRLDRFLYGIASQYKDAQQVRQASPTLLAAMCATAAFQDVKHQALFDVCNREYRALVSASLFENRSHEFVRALCIGSFWLPDASRILSSDAIRRAVDCRLHRQFYRLTEPPRPADNRMDPTLGLSDARDKMRLWYLLYICDQHLSILYNQDSLMRQEKDAIENRELFLARQGLLPSAQDVRLMSQVSLLVIMCQIRDVFGCEQNKPVSKTLAVQFTHFTRELDQWYAKYSGIFEPDPYIGSFPLAGLTMHYQFGKLYLGHHVFRGLETDPIPPHFVSVASGAREAAALIFSLILDNDAFRENILGMPYYFHIMISFAGNFLLEVCMKYREQLNINVEDEFRRVSDVVALFARTAAVPQHPIARVTIGLMRKLTEYTTALGIDSMMAGSPFAYPKWAAARDYHSNPLNGSTGPASFEMQFTTMLPDDFLYTGFGGMNFTDSQFHCIPQHASAEQ